jgi:hypothetical protein
MELINKDFAELTKDDFDEVISNLVRLSILVIPLLLQANANSRGLEDVAQFACDLQVAADAVEEIKNQIHGE